MFGFRRSVFGAVWKLNEIVRILDSVWNHNSLTTGPNLSCPKSERSDFGRSLYILKVYFQPISEFKYQVCGRSSQGSLRCQKICVLAQPVCQGTSSHLNRKSLVLFHSKLQAHHNLNQILKGLQKKIRQNGELQLFKSKQKQQIKFICGGTSY